MLIKQNKLEVSEALSLTLSQRIFLFRPEHLMRVELKEIERQELLDVLFQVALSEVHHQGFFSEIRKRINFADSHSLHLSIK